MRLLGIKRYARVMLELHTQLRKSHVAVTHALLQLMHDLCCSYTRSEATYARWRSPAAVTQYTRSAANFIAVMLRWNCYLLL